MAGLFYMQNVKLYCGGGWEEACLDSFKSSESMILEKSEDRWKIICSIAQDSRDSSTGESSTQHTPHDKSLFLKITWLMIITEVIIAANNSHHCCYSNAYQYARCFNQKWFSVLLLCISTKKGRFSVVLFENSIKTITINSFFLPRWGQLKQCLLSEWNAIPYCIDQFYWSGPNGCVWTHKDACCINIVPDTLLTGRVTQHVPAVCHKRAKQAKCNLWRATYHLLSWLIPRYTLKTFPHQSTNKKEVIWK